MRRTRPGNRLTPGGAGRRRRHRQAVSAAPPHDLYKVARPEGSPAETRPLISSDIEALLWEDPSELLSVASER
jgi:hypothetical protein